MANGEKTQGYIETLMNDISFLNGNKNIEVDIIQEGLLKQILEEESNSVLFVEETKNTTPELTILNINIKVKKISTIHKKQKFFSADIDVIIHFKKKMLFRLNVDNSKLHKCYYTKIKAKIEEFSKEKLTFRETVLRLFHFINDKDFVKCLCERETEILFVNNRILASATCSGEHSPFYKDHAHLNTKNEENKKEGARKEEAEKERCAKGTNEKKVESVGTKNEKKTMKINTTRNQNKGDIDEGKLKKEGEAYDTAKKEIIESSELDKKSSIEKKVSGQESPILNEGEKLEKCDKKNITDEPLPIEEVKEMSAFLNGKAKKEKEVKIKNEENENQENVNQEKKVEEEKKKKKIKSILENVPLTVMLAENGNELCKSLIDKHSRYYRDFKEERILGCGGFGYAVKVRDKRFNIIYALKKITLDSEPRKKRDSYLYHNSDDSENVYNSYIMEEAIMIAKLKHEHIVRYYDAWVEENVDFFLYEEVIKPYEKEMTKGKSKKGVSEKENREKGKKAEHHSSEKKKAEEKSKEEKEKTVQNKHIKEIYNYYKKKKSLDNNAMEGKYLYILMEYCPGRTLREAIDCGFIYKNEKLIWALCKQILKGISYIHEMKIIHRDIKPSNIFLQINDNVLTAKIGDFGLTTRIDNKEINPSAGTVHYMSPEQINGQPFDQKADMFSLGVVFFEMFHEPFTTSMERSVVLSNLLKGIFPEYMKADPKKMKFLCSLLAINPQERPSAYNLLHENFPFFFEKDFTEIYNLVENRRNCDEAHTIIRTLFEKFEYIDEEEKSKNKGSNCFSAPQKKTENDDIKIKNKGKKKIIKSFKNRGAIYLITPVILLHKYFIDIDHTFIEEYSISYSSSKKKENKISNIYINTSKNTNVNNLIYLLDIYGNVITLRPSFFLSISEYIYHNINHYNKYNDTNIFLKFYTYGYTYKNQVLNKSRQLKKNVLNNYIYPEEIEKILYAILINTRNIYEEEELYYLSVFANADILVSVTTIYDCVSNGKNLLFLWSYADLLPFILSDCFDISENIIHKVSSELRKNSFLLSSKSAIATLLQKYKIQNSAKVSDYIFNLFQLKCETNKVKEYLNSLQKFLEDLVYKNSASGSGSGNVTWITNLTKRGISAGAKSRTGSNTNAGLGIGSFDISGIIGKDNEKEDGGKRDEYEKYNKRNSSRDCFSKMRVFYLLEKIKKIDSFINTNAFIQNVTFDLFLNFEESFFSDEIVFYVISENKNREVIAYGGKFDTLIKKMNSNNALYIKCYGVEINVEKIQFKVVNCSDKVSLNVASGFILEKSNIIKNDVSQTPYQNNFSTGNESEEMSQTIITKGHKNDNDKITYGKRNNTTSSVNTSNKNSKHLTVIQCTGCGGMTCNRKNCVKNKYNVNIPLNTSIRSNPSNPFTSSSSVKIIIHVEKINALLIAYDLTKKLLKNNVPSYTYLDIHDSHKKKNAKNFKTKNMKFLITIKSDMHDDLFNPLNPIDFSDVVYKIYNFENNEYYYLHQKELILYIVNNV